MPDTAPTILGITGVIGSGKSLVGRILEDAGEPVIDTDKVVHELLTNDTPPRAAVVERFGKDVQREDGAIADPGNDADDRQETEQAGHDRVSDDELTIKSDRRGPSGLTSMFRPFLARVSGKGVGGGSIGGAKRGNFADTRP